MGPQARKLMAKIRSGGALGPEDELKLLKLESKVAMSTGEGDKAVQTLEQIVEKNPLDGEALLLAGDYYARNGQPEKAEFRYDAAAKLDGFQADAFLKHAQLQGAAPEIHRGRGIAAPGPEGEAARQRAALPGARGTGGGEGPILSAPAVPERALISQLVMSLRRFIPAAVLFLLLCAPGVLHAQEAGSVSGLVISTWNGTPLGGVIVTVRGTTLAAQTDGTGRFLIGGVPPGDQTLRFSKAGYAAAVVTEVRVVPGQTTTVNGTLRPEFFDMEEYEVTAEAFQEQALTILQERQEGSSIMEAIGSEQFRKLGVSDAADIMTKVTGTTVVEGKFAVIRGLGDRYNVTLLEWRGDARRPIRTGARPSWT